MGYINMFVNSDTVFSQKRIMKNGLVRLLYYKLPSVHLSMYKITKRKHVCEILIKRLLKIFYSQY